MIFPTLAQAQLWPQSQADRQAQAGHAQVPNYWANADAQEWSEAQIQALTWPYFKPTTSNPVFSLYDALGRPENLKIGGMFRSRIEGINNQFRPAPVGPVRRSLELPPVRDPGSSHEGFVPSHTPPSVDWRSIRPSDAR